MREPVPVVGHRFTDGEATCEWTDERCPLCGARLIVDQDGDKWCSFVSCDWDSWTEHSDHREGAS